jgi:predicted nucleotidyltransferase
MKTAKFITANRSKIYEIASKHGAQDIRLFGSFARGEGKTDSDVDLLVSMRPGSSLLDIIAIKQDLEDFLKKKVDVVTEESLSPYIREEVFKEAINL